MRNLPCILLGFLVIAGNLQAQTLKTAEQARNRMVDEEIVAAGVVNQRVIASMRNTPRHEFVLPESRRYSYYDMALPIGDSQTISPPFVVAYMTEELEPSPTDKVLEIGTGSGYQAAVLSPLVAEVYTIEIVESLGLRAAGVLKRLGYDNVHAKVGDGYQGWPEHAPFDKIIVTCSPESIPEKLIEQLKEGGRMVIPVGERYHQNLFLMTKVDGKLEKEALRPTLFVPMTGSAEEGRQVLPDPANPTLTGGGFESRVGDTPRPDGWHYGRQLEVIEGDAPAGNCFVRFTNKEPGRGCHALQGLGVDGREVRKIRLSARVRGSGIKQGQDARQLPGMVITFYGEERGMVGEAHMGPWRGSFPWMTQSEVVAVPAAAREAIVRVGLFGATGEIDYDEVALERVD